MGSKNMANPANNPLFKHFRQPAIYLKLPGQGRFWPDDALDMPPTGEIPVYPMTVKDEITIKTPDALMNGVGVIDTIQSCCPNIKNAWKIPATDLDAILIAIRLASYGAEMDIASNCPECKEENSNVIDLCVLLDNIKIPNYIPITIEGLTFNFKPQAFETMNNTNIMLFEQRKLLDTITNSELSDEEKTKQFNLIFPKLTEMNVLSLVYCIESIVTEDGKEVSEFKFIKEFIENCDRNVYAEIKSKIDEFIQSTKPDALTIECSECKNTYSSELNFDNANFFG
jgi:hypothetical protein